MIKDFGDMMWVGGLESLPFEFHTIRIIFQFIKLNENNIKN